MLDGLVGQLVGDKPNIQENQRVVAYDMQLVGLVGERQATTRQKTQRFQCLSACRYLSLLRRGLSDRQARPPYGRRRVGGIPQQRFTGNLP